MSTIFITVTINCAFVRKTISKFYLFYANQPLIIGLPALFSGLVLDIAVVHENQYTVLLPPLLLEQTHELRLTAHTNTKRENYVNKCIYALSLTGRTNEEE